VIPKNRDGLNRLSKAEERHKALLGHLMYVAQLVAKQGKSRVSQLFGGVTKFVHAHAVGGGGGSGVGRLNLPKGPNTG
jgi:hypothetical protein